MANQENDAIEASTAGDWGIIHFNRFCPEEIEYCTHELMLDGLEETLDLLDKNCKVNNLWREKCLYGHERARHDCFICAEECQPIDYPIGIYRTTEKRKKAFVVHDTCFRDLRGLRAETDNEEATLSVIKALLNDKKRKEELQMYSIFDSPSICLECPRGRQGAVLETVIQKKILNCSDPFCPASFHFACAQRSEKCSIDFFEKALYCKDHEELMDRPNASAIRGKMLSMSPTTWDKCIECKEAVARFPVRGHVFYLKCCSSFSHWDCVFTRLDLEDYKCRCGSRHRFFKALQRQGLCLMDYRASIKKVGIRIRRPSEHNESDKEDADGSDPESDGDETDEDSDEENVEVSDEETDEGEEESSDSYVDVIDEKKVDDAAEKDVANLTKNIDVIDISDDDDDDVMIIDDASAKRARLE